MNKCVLIVDDDQEFIELLQGIFSQADYTVHTAFEAESGLEVLKSEPIELIITDQRLPGGLCGSDFIVKIREYDTNLPVIMISGFLDDDTIRELIRDGVEGVFIKPLNIFSLLKKAGEIIEERTRAKSIGSGSGEPNQAIPGNTSVGQIEGLSEVGAKFLAQARESAAFRRNLLLIGPPGTLFEEIAKDIISLGERSEHCVTLKPGQINTDKLNGFFTGEHAERRLALILEDAESLSQEEVDQLIQLADEKGGINGVLRLVFCLGRSVEEMYDAGTIDEEFYMFLGTNELMIPELKTMPEDLVEIARKEIEEQCENARFDLRTGNVLLEHDWPENMVELRAVIVRALTLSQPLPPELKHFETALHPVEQEDNNGMRSTLERFLSQEKARYSEAVELLLNS